MIDLYFGYFIWQINTNGMLAFTGPVTSFGSSDSDVIPAGFGPFIAPYWDDVDIRDGGEISYR